MKIVVNPGDSDSTLQMVVVRIPSIGDDNVDDK